MKRRLRQSVNAAVPIVGTALVFGSILLFFDPIQQVIGAAVGVLMIQAGIWKLTHPLLPSERKYTALRSEVDQFIRLVRRMNAAALGVKEIDTPETRAAFDAELEGMRRSLDRMALLAGRTEPEVTFAPSSMAAR